MQKLPDLPGNNWRGPVTERQLIVALPNGYDPRKSAAAKVKGQPVPVLAYVVGRIA
jgi:hypothetical protein